MIKVFDKHSPKSCLSPQCSIYIHSMFISFSSLYKTIFIQYYVNGYSFCFSFFTFTYFNINELLKYTREMVLKCFYNPLWTINWTGLFWKMNSELLIENYCKPYKTSYCIHTHIFYRAITSTNLDLLFSVLWSL